MKIKYLVLGCLGIFGGWTNLFAQNQWTEFGGFFGVSNYLGELQQVEFETSELHPAYGLFLRSQVNRSFAIKMHFYKGTISGSDANYEGLLIRQRNLNFESPVYEMGLQLEITLMKFGERQQRLAAPYLFVGCGIFHFNPQAYYQEQWIELQPLGTEGQGLPTYPERAKYSLVQASLPLGIGFNFLIQKKVVLGFELGFRKTWTDYLDDISMTYPDIELLETTNPMAAALSYRTPEYDEHAGKNPEGLERGSPENNDVYFFGGMTLGIVLNKKYKNDRRNYRKIVPQPGTGHLF